MSGEPQAAPRAFGKYEVRRELGRGGMSIVYEGFDPLIGRRVALKTFLSEPEEGSGADNLLSRLRREAQAAGRLSHPHIVAVYDYGEETVTGADGRAHVRAYIAMEFIEGRSLESYLAATERFPVNEAVRILGETLEALEYSHAHGVVHRDIKPANILLLPDGAVKVADFGVARIESSTLTQVGTVLGSPAFMSPEQFTGQTVDGRSDLYSAGVVLYQLLTGELPFTGSFATIMHKVLNERAIPPSTLNVQVPPALDAIVAKAMGRRPDERYANAAEFRAALTQLAVQAGPGCAPASATQIRPATLLAAAPARRRGALIALGALAAVLVAAGLWWSLRGPRPTQAGPAPAPAPAPAATVRPIGAALPVAASLLDSPVNARSAVVSAVGIVHSSESDAAAERALWLEARRQVVAKAAALYVKPRSLRSNYGLLRAKLLARTDDFITGILREGPAVRSSDGAVVGTLWATVSVRDVQKALNEISRAERIEFIRNHGDPRIAVSIRIASSELDGSTPAPRSAVAENVLKERIRAFGFQVVDAEQAKPPPDFVVDGEVRFKKLSARLPASGLTIEKVVLTSWTVRAIDAKSGEEVYHNTRIPQKQSWASEELALSEVGNLVGGEFSPAFFLEYFDFRPAKVRVRFEGLPADAASHVLDVINGRLSVLSAAALTEAGSPGVTFELELSAEDEEALPVTVQRAIVAPLNSRVGANCFALASTEGTQFVVAIDPGCTTGDRLHALEAAPDEALSEDGATSV